MTAVGIDLGGTKIEAQVFDNDWKVKERRRIATPNTYPALVAAMAEQIAWAEGVAGQVPVGISAAGLVNPATGLALTSNLAATGKPFPADIATAVGRSVTYINDCRALTLSEAQLGAAKGKSPVIGLVIGTGIGGGLAIDGRLVTGPAMVGGEFGHIPAPAHLVQSHGLPIVTCGCGQPGCYETLVSGPGLALIAKTLTGRSLTPPQIVAGKTDDPALQIAWEAWCAVLAELLITLTRTVDPEVIVLGGGMSQVTGLVPDLTAALAEIQWPKFAIPELVLAEGGEASGARGAALAAAQEAGDV